MASPLQHYRDSTIGSQLEASIDELIGAGLMQSKDKESILLKFDRAFAEELSACVSSTKVKVIAPIIEYKHLDDTWTFKLNGVELKIDGYTIKSSNPVILISRKSRKNKK